MAEENSDGGLTALVMNCAFAILAGQPTVTVSSKGTPPKGFTRGELLSIGTNGASNYAVDPIKTLAWAQKQILRACGKTSPQEPTNEQ